MVWPAKEFRLTLAVLQTASALVAAPRFSKTVAGVLPTIWTRKKSALEEFEAWETGCS